MPTSTRTMGRQQGSTRLDHGPVRGLNSRVETHAVQAGTCDAVRFSGRSFDTDPYDLRDTVVFLPVIGKLLLKMLQEIDLICMDTPGLPLPQRDVFDVRISAL